MTKTILLFLALFALAWPSSAAVKRKTPKHRTHSAITPSRKAPKAKAIKGRRQRHTRRSFQQAPTQERYKEIQQALASKGYLQGEPNGEWGMESQEALKKFQADQNLTPDGKLNSLSLIALGLGPKRLSAQSNASPPTDTAK